MEKKKDLFVAIDGHALVHRAFHAYPPTLTTSDGLQVNAVYGFTVMLLAMLKQFSPKYVICTFDTKAPTFRHTQFSDYKGTRKATEQSLTDQFPVVEQVLEALNVPILKKEGYEADDILGTISEWVAKGKWSGYDFDTYLLTGDRDLLQLISERVKVCMPQGSFSNLVIFDEEKTFERYGYYPEQVVDYKGVVGDASDNIPGIKGVGEKTTLELLRLFNTLEGIYGNLDKVKPRYAYLLKEGLEQAEFSRELATIKRDMDLELDLNSCILSDFEEELVVSLFRKLEFKSLITKLPKSSNGAPKAGQLGMFKKEENPPLEQEQVEIETPTNCIWAYIGPEDRANESFLLEVLVNKQGDISSKQVEAFTRYPSCETYMYNFEDFCAQKQFPTDINDENLIDIKLMAYNLSSGKKSYNLSSIAFDLTAKTLPEKLDISDIARVGTVLVEIVQSLKEQMKKTKYIPYVTNWISFLTEKYKVSGITGFELVAKYLDLPVAKVLAKMEKRGVAINIDRIKQLSEILSGEIKELTSNVYREIGHEFNINSPKQLADVLFVELGLPLIEGERSTREEVLTQLLGMHPCIEYVLKYRELSKLLNTYITPLIEISKKEQLAEVHTDFKQTGASSGRFSSVNPNMQNLPARGDWAGRMREIFVAREGFTFVGADYSQIEFRVMADISKDSVLVSDFNQGKDIHLTTASRILNKKEEEITKLERNLGKTVNFAILFGQTPYGLSKLAQITPELAKQYIAEYFREYEGVAKYIEESKQMATKFGYVQSMFGRTRYISGLSSRNRNVYNGAVREAINMPIQGGEADIMRLAMVEIDKLIEKDFKNDAYILLQIHDELIFEVKDNLVDQFMHEVKELMISIVKLNVPLDVHISKGSNMNELK